MLEILDHGFGQGCSLGRGFQEALGVAIGIAGWPGTGRQEIAVSAGDLGLPEVQTATQGLDLLVGDGVVENRD